jgi:hypothetical protein
MKRPHTVRMFTPFGKPVRGSLILCRSWTGFNAKPVGPSYASQESGLGRNLLWRLWNHAGPQNLSRGKLRLILPLQSGVG